MKRSEFIKTLIAIPAATMAVGEAIGNEELKGPEPITIPSDGMSTEVHMPDVCDGDRYVLMYSAPSDPNELMVELDVGFDLKNSFHAEIVVLSPDGYLERYDAKTKGKTVYSRVFFYQQGEYRLQAVVYPTPNKHGHSEVVTYRHTPRIYE
jgi:hypothetical protein